MRRPPSVLQSAQGAARASTGIGGVDLGGATLALRADEWCVRPQVTNKGTRYSARALAFASNEAVTTARLQAEAAAAEVRGILDLLRSSGDQISALKTLATTVVDPDNWQLIAGGFSFGIDRDAAQGLRPL